VTGLRLALLALVVAAAACGREPAVEAQQTAMAAPVDTAAALDARLETARQALDTATFAGGCFWCMEPPYDELPGVSATTSGYTGGRTASPTYEQVSAGGTGHAEVVRVIFDPRKVTYDRLLDVFWKNIDPFAVDRQFCDAGDQYRSAIFVHDAEQRRLALASKAAVERKLGKPVATEIADASAFYPAEEYHQDYYTKNPVRYKFYRWNCGRDARLDEVWGEDRG
jgi:peptide-methionine (S)-S-oxide reductase